MSRPLAGLIGFLIVFMIFIEVMDEIYADRDCALWRAIWRGWRGRDA